jgi:4-amino-4-deoxy-L-arabinose transferase-like glycosyltransferase
MGMGTLTKGLLGIIVPCGIIFIYLLLQKDFSLLKTKQFYIAVFIYLLIASPWYIYMGLVHGSKYLSFFLIGNHINLFLKGEYSLARPIWYYLPNIIGGFAPWSLFLPFMIYCLYVYHREGKGITNVNFLYAWIGFILVFFSLSKGKQEEYILQIYPAFSILLSLCLSYAVKHIPSVNMKKWVRLTVFLVSFVFLLASFSLHLLNRTIFTSYGELEAIPIFFIFLVIILICKYTASSIKAAAVFSIIITYLFYFMLITFYLPLYEKEYKFVKYFAQYYKNNKRADEDIGYYRIGIPSLVYYTNEKVYIFMSIEEIKKVAEKRRLYLAVDARGYDAYDYLQNNFTVLMKKKQFPTTLKSFIKITQGLGAEEVYLLKNNL